MEERLNILDVNVTLVVSIKKNQIKSSTLKHVLVLKMIGNVIMVSIEE